MIEKRKDGNLTTCVAGIGYTCVSVVSTDRDGQKIKGFALYSRKRGTLYRSIFGVNGVKRVVTDIL